MCPAAACLPCWPLSQFACSCCCPYLPDLLGHMDFFMFSGRVFPHIFWQSTLWAAKDYKAPLSALPASRRGGGNGHALQQSQSGRGHNFSLDQETAVMCSACKAVVVPVLLPLLWVPAGKVWAEYFLNYLNPLEAPIQGCWEKWRAGLQDGLGAYLMIQIKFKLLYVRFLGFFVWLFFREKPVLVRF